MTATWRNDLRKHGRRWASASFISIILKRLLSLFTSRYKATLWHFLEIFLVLFVTLPFYVVFYILRLGAKGLLCDINLQMCSCTHSLIDSQTVLMQQTSCKWKGATSKTGMKTKSVMWYLRYLSGCCSASWLALHIGQRAFVCFAILLLVCIVIYIFCQLKEHSLTKVHCIL